MKSLAIVFVGLAAVGFGGMAFAEDATTGSWNTTTGPAVMSESELDRVVGGLTLHVDPGAVVPIEPPAGLVNAAPPPIVGGQAVGGPANARQGAGNSPVRSFGP